MATLRSRCSIGALRTPQAGPARPRRLEMVQRVTQFTSPRPAPLPIATSAAAVEAPTTGAAPARPPLFLLHRHVPRTSDAEYSVSQEQLQKLRDDLKAMEKVAKRAAWFSAVEATDGEHVLLLTDCAKLGSKYDLQCMPADVSSFTLELPGRSVVVPLGDVTAALRAHAAQPPEVASSDDEAAVPGGLTQATAVTAVGAEDKKAAKKARKEGEAAIKAMAKMEAKSKRVEAETGSTDEEDGVNQKEEKAKSKKEKEMKKMEKKAAKGMKEMSDDDKESGSDSEDEADRGKAGMVVGVKEKDEKETKKDEKKQEKEKDKKGPDATMKMEEEGSGGESSGGESSDEDCAGAPVGQMDAATTAMGGKAKVVAMEDSESESSSESGDDAPEAVKPTPIPVQA